MQPDERFPFHVTVAPLEGRGQFLLFTRRALEAQVLPGTQCVIEESELEEFRALVAGSEAKALAGQWGIGESTFHRIREALGVAGEYDGNSRVTAWRRKYHEHSDDQDEKTNDSDNETGTEG